MLAAGTRLPDTVLETCKSVECRMHHGHVMDSRSGSVASLHRLARLQVDVNTLPDEWLLSPTGCLI